MQLLHASLQMVESMQQLHSLTPEPQALIPTLQSPNLQDIDEEKKDELLPSSWYRKQEHHWKNLKEALPLQLMALPLSAHWRKILSKIYLCSKTEQLFPLQPYKTLSFFLDEGSAMRRVIDALPRVLEKAFQDHCALTLSFCRLAHRPEGEKSIGEICQVYQLQRLKALEKQVSQSCLAIALKNSLAMKLTRIFLCEEE